MPREERIADLLGRMTLEEKAALLAGRDIWHLPAIERLGVPALQMSDGPSGVRGDAAPSMGPPAACFPCGSALAATWDPDLVRRVTAAMADEARARGAHVVLAPTVNIHRSPLAGRNFESFSEDPFLCARIAAAFVEGLQQNGVAACVKHFACNDSEFERQAISSDVGERALREIHLPAFEAAIRDAGSWSLMAAYNRVNGTFACEHPELLTEILKKEWGFEGFVVSDWLATHSTVPAARAGLDVEMPGPPRFFGAALADAVRSGELEEEIIDDHARRVLRVMALTGALDGVSAIEEQPRDRPEHRAVAREAAAAGLVLLKNENVLPLRAADLRSLAVIGPNASIAVIQGGGSANVNPHSPVSPLAGIRSRAGDGVEVTFEPGCAIHRTLPPIERGWLRTEDGREGILVEYFRGDDMTGAPARSEIAPTTRFLWFGQPPVALVEGRFSARIRGRFVPDRDGHYSFGLSAAGLSRLFVDGELLIDNWTSPDPGEVFFGLGSAERRGELDFQAGSTHEVVIEYRSTIPGFAALQAGAARRLPDDAMERAASAAAKADAALVVVGLNDDWETEGHDRADMELPGAQASLIEKVARANPRTIVVLNVGGVVSMDWAERVPAIIQQWYPGYEGGTALAEVLFGDVNPSGRLPTTFPERLEDNPAFLNYPGENGHVLYGEGIFVGYRYYDAKRVQPRFPFGYGLSYTTFGYADPRAERASARAGEKIEVSVEITNTGPRRGAEVVQCYVRDVHASLARPVQELKGFARIHLEPGETRRVAFALDERAFAYWDPARPGWVVEPGEFEVRFGASSRDIRCTLPVEIVA